MHVWAEVCHLLQSSKSPHTGVLAEESQAFFKHSPHTNSIHKSAILRNNYISLLSRFYINRLLEGNNTLNNGVKARKLPSFSPVGERVLKLTLRDNYFIATVDILNAQAPWCLRFWDQCRTYYSLALQAWVEKRKITEVHVVLRNARTMELAHSVYQQSLWSSYHAR